jgi:hypothetical protein
LYVIASFQYSSDLEMALSEVVQLGIPKKQILALPLDKPNDSSGLLDAAGQTDGRSMVDLAAIFGMIGMLLGSIYGFELAWGPVIWAIIGFAGGLVTGFAVDAVGKSGRRRRSRARSSAIPSEVIVLVRCDALQSDKVKAILCTRKAIGVSMFGRQPVG